MGTKRRIKALDIVKDIRSGMSEDQLMSKYGLSPDDLKSAVRRLSSLRKGIVREMAADIRSGMTEFEILAKYDISPKGLQAALKKLLKYKLLEPSEIYLPSIVYNDRIRADDLRSLVRHNVTSSIAVCEENKQENRGTVRDITTEGVGITGIETEVEEVKALAILGDDLGVVEPFEFEAQCRWVANEDIDDPTTSGFHIVKISEQDQHRLQEFIQFVRDPERGGATVFAS